MKRVMRPLHIVWQRLVNSKGQTCNRCGDTYEALRDAVAKLKDALGPLGLEPILETKEINEESFKREVSNAPTNGFAAHVSWCAAAKSVNSNT